MFNKKRNSRSRRRKDDKYKIRTLREFKQFVKDNKSSGKNWYYGLDGKWWWGMSEEDAIKCIEQNLIPGIESDKIVIASTWNISCGIATYTKYLFDNLNKVAPNSFVINPINKGVLKHSIKGGLTHLQHEFGIIPKLPKMKGRLIITWHTVSISKNMARTIKKIESDYNVVAHIVHSECARHDISTSKDIWTVPHGSTLIPEMKKEDARRLLGINIDMPIGFVFGFQSSDKNYQRLISAAKNTGIHLIISGASHHDTNSVIIPNDDKNVTVVACHNVTGLGAASLVIIPNDKNVTFINRFLTEEEVNLYASASDMLLFDYTTKDHYSVSGAMHRIIGAGRPVICSDIRHFNDVRHNYDCLKFKSQSKLEECIRRVLQDSKRLSLAAREYAEKTSWEKIAKCHIEIYKKYSNIASLQLIK